MPTHWIRRFGNIEGQPRYKRGIDCYWDATVKKTLPYISPDKHRFTLYQAHLNTNHKKKLKYNNFTSSHCGHCGCKGHTRQSCWQSYVDLHLPLSSTSKMRFQGPSVAILAQAAVSVFLFVHKNFKMAPITLRYGHLVVHVNDPDMLF